MHVSGLSEENPRKGSIERTLVDFRQASSTMQVRKLSSLHSTTLTFRLKASVRGSLIQCRTSRGESNLQKDEVVDPSSLNLQALSRSDSSVKRLYR